MLEKFSLSNYIQCFIHIYTHIHYMHIIFHLYHYSLISKTFKYWNSGIKFHLTLKTAFLCFTDSNSVSKRLPLQQNVIWKRNRLNWWLVKWHLLNSWFSSFPINKAHIWHLCIANHWNNLENPNCLVQSLIFYGWFFKIQPTVKNIKNKWSQQIFTKY